MFCRSDCKSVFKVLSLSIGMQFATDLALMNTQPQRFKADDATRTNHNRGISWCPDNRKGKLLNLVSLTNLFEMLNPRLVIVLKLSKKCIFCNFVLTSARNLSVLKQFTYMDLKVFIIVSQKMTCLIRACRGHHMKNKCVRQSHVSSRSSEAIDVWKVARHLPSRRVVACDDYSF